jgi:transcription elongation factor GreA
MLEAKIIQIGEQLKNAKIIDESEISGDVVAIGTTVTLLDVEFNEEVVMRVVSLNAVISQDIDNLTSDSPLGKAILGCHEGDEVSVPIPNGSTINYKIIKITV